jgi:hypothetical protein
MPVGVGNPPPPDPARADGADPDLSRRDELEARARALVAPQDPALWPHRRRAAALVAGIVLALATSLSVALWLPDIGPRSVQWWMILLTVVAGLASALLMGLWLGSRLRLTIDATAVDGSKSPAAAAHVAARVGDLGGSTPGGLELARGTDTSALLGSALTDVPEGKLAQLAVRILQGALGTSPWRANVDQFNATTVSVVVTRNGRQAGSAVIDSGLLLAEAGLTGIDPDTDQIDMHRFVAAGVVATLARYHPREFAGLCGASDWRSLGLYYLGSTRYDSPDYYAAQRRAFARAVELDRQNWLAQLGFRRAVDRRSTDADVLARYRRWLLRLLCPGGVLSQAGYEALRLRALYTCLSLSINSMFARETDPTTTGQVAASAGDAVSDALDLFRAIELVGLSSSNRRIAQDLAVTAASLALTALERADTSDDVAAGELRRRVGPYLRHVNGAAGGPGATTTGATRERLDPATALSTKALYNTGCYYGSRPHLDEARALRCLRLAVEDDRFRRWALDDPQLAELRQRPTFWDALGYLPRTEFLELATVAPFGARLRGAGLVTAREIARRSVDALVEQTGARPAEAAAVRRLAFLRTEAPGPVSGLSTEVLHELVARGCASRGALRRLGADRPALAEQVVTALGRRVYVSPTTATALRTWLGGTPTDRTPAPAGPGSRRP